MTSIHTNETIKMTYSDYIETMIKDNKMDRTMFYTEHNDVYSIHINITQSLSTPSTNNYIIDICFQIEMGYSHEVYFGSYTYFTHGNHNCLLREKYDHNEIDINEMIQIFFSKGK